MKISSLFYSLLLCSALLPLSLPLSAQPQVVSVPEMGQLPFDIGRADVGSCTLTQAEREQWTTLFPFVSSLITDQLVVNLSRWAVAETRSYHYQPALAPDLNCFEKDGKVNVYQVTLDELPSHHPLVRRYLKAYLRGPQVEGVLAVNQIVITIQGEREE